ncbi:phiSA1p31-related protein [Streptomyces sp. t39]|uniref:phiSA1p31-related protein n=1 Tax=Streptomyces sp. t39 TaxID=1828156 RepID=UPI0011CD585F|nr:phiSA1p31-related protein [Streptomyces sp. t39]TXS55224.1 hypothetical protein EAO77_02685 [Streptomyces sp. t39]
MRTTFLLDAVPGIHPGTEIDLTRDWLDFLGGRWRWTEKHTDAGVPTMRQIGTDAPTELYPLDELYLWRGPLTPAPRPATTDQAAAVLHAPYKGDEQVRPPLPVKPVLKSPAATAVAAVVAEPKPADPVPSPGMFAQFLARLRRGGAQ